MRDSIKKIIEKTFVLEYRLPNDGIDKSSITNLSDYFYDVTDQGVSKSIYNSIVDYCLNDIEIDLLSLDQHQIYAVDDDVYKVPNKYKFQLRIEEKLDIDEKVKSSKVLVENLSIV